MKLETKFNVGDKLWAISPEGLTKFKVARILVEATNYGIFVRYISDDDITEFDEENVSNDLRKIELKLNK